MVVSKMPRGYFNKNFSHIVVCLFGLMIVACSADKSSRTNHEGPKTGSAQTSPTPITAQDVQALNTLYNEREQLLNTINGKSTAPQEILKIIKRVAPYILHSNFIIDPRYNKSSEVIAALSIFNSGFYRLFTEHPDLLTGEQLQKKYLDTLFQGCIDGLKNCHNLKFFSQDYQSAQILIYMAQQKGQEVNTQRGQPDGKIYQVLTADLFRFVFAAYEIKNSQYSSELDLLLVRHSKDLFAHIKSTTLSNPNEWRYFRDALNTALLEVRSRAQENSSSSEQYCNFMIQSNAMTFDVKDNEQLDTRGLRTFIAEFIKCTAQRGQLTKKIQEQLLAEQKDQIALLEKSNIIDDHFNDRGYNYALGYIAKSPFLMKGLDIKHLTRNDLLHFTLDRLFYEQIDSTVALEYWKHLGSVSDDQVIEYARNYLRVQTANLIKLSIVAFADHFKLLMTTKGELGSDLFDNVMIYMNSKVQFEWEQLKTRIRIVKEFLVQIYDVKYKHGNPNAKKMTTADNYVKLKDQLSSINQHLNFSVVMPLTLGMSYYMAKAEGNIKFFVPWWPSANEGDQWFDIVAVDALLEFFASDRYSSKPLFRIGDASFRLSNLQKLHTFDFALRVGLFELFPFYLYQPDQQYLIFNDEYLSKNNEYLFFKQFVKNHMKSDIDTQASDVEALKIRRSHPLVTDVIQKLCNNPLQAPAQLELSQLSSTTLFTADSTNVGIFSMLSNNYSLLNKIYPLRNRYELLIKLKSLIESHLDGPSAQNTLSAEKYASRKKIIQHISIEMERFKKLEREYMRLGISLEQSVVNKQRNCLQRFNQADWIRREALLDKNEEYYLSVHAAMSLIRATQALEDQTNPTELEQNVDKFIHNLRNTQKLGNSDQELLRQAMIDSLSERMRQLVLQLKAHSLLTDLSFSRGHKKVLEEALNIHLGIHNYDINPFGANAGKGDFKYGFYVYGAPSFSSVGEALRRLNAFNGESFSQSRWDTLARLRTMLNQLIVNPAEYQISDRLGIDYGNSPINIGQSVQVQIPSTFIALADMQLYKEFKIERLEYNPDSRVFLRSAFRQLLDPKSAIAVGWMSTTSSDLNLLQSRFSYLLDLYALGSIELEDSDTTKCFYDVWGDVVATKSYSGETIPSAPLKSEQCKAIRLTGAEVVEEFLNLTDLLRLNAKQSRWVQLAELRGPFAEKVNQYFQYRTESSPRKWTFFDEFFRNYFTTVSAYTASGKSVAVETFRGRTEFKDFRETKTTDIIPSRHLFELNTTPTQIERNRLRRKIFQHLGQIEEVEEAIKDLEDAKVRIDDLIFERTTTPNNDEDYIDGQWRFITTKTRTDDTPIYLNEQNSAKQWFYRFLRTYFISETSCDALPTSLDPDAQSLTTWQPSAETASCASAFERWQQSREQQKLESRKIRRQKGT